MHRCCRHHFFEHTQHHAKHCNTLKPLQQLATLSHYRSIWLGRPRAQNSFSVHARVRGTGKKSHISTRYSIDYVKSPWRWHVRISERRTMLRIWPRLISSGWVCAHQTLTSIIFLQTAGLYIYIFTYMYVNIDYKFRREGRLDCLLMQTNIGWQQWVPSIARALIEKGPLFIGCI